MEVTHLIVLFPLRYTFSMIIASLRGLIVLFFCSVITYFKDLSPKIQSNREPRWSSNKSEALDVFWVLVGIEWTGESCRYPPGRPSTQTSTKVCTKDFLGCLFRWRECQCSHSRAGFCSATLTCGRPWSESHRSPLGLRKGLDKSADFFLW